jgi:hypothetical protein
VTTSGIRPPDDVKYTLREVKRGLFVVENAYAGRYEFFKGRPAPATPADNHRSGSPIENGLAPSDPH